ncbi:MAG: nucleotidyltransferase domain-containing protein [Cyanobacteria bacterium]|nr:nucleotidyltransferase domain-containing protein [Cyanobacteriota bacterium]
MDYRKIIKEQFENDDDLFAVILYGSIVNNELHDKSDIDIAFLPKNNDFDRRAKYSQLHDIDRNLDIVNLKKINPTLGMQIIKNHELLIVNDLAEWEAWKTQVLTQYHDLKISNRNIIKDLGKYSPLEKNS